MSIVDLQDLGYRKELSKMDFLFWREKGSIKASTINQTTHVGLWETVYSYRGFC